MPRKRRKKIKIKFEPMKTTWGLAFVDDHLIVLDPRMDDRTMLEVGTHEVAHIVAPYLEESVIEELGLQVSCVLTRLGFRRVEEH